MTVSIVSIVSTLSIVRYFVLDAVFLPFHWPRAHHVTSK